MTEQMITIRILRQQHRLTQEVLAERIGISRQAFSAIEAGHARPSIDLAYRLALVFEHPIEELFFGKLFIEPQDSSATLPTSASIALPTIEETQAQTLEPVGDFPVNLDDTRAQFILTAALPGYTAEELTIEVTDATVFIAARSRKFQNTHALITEFASAPVARTIALPAKVVAEKAQAQIKNGILTIILQKHASPKRTVVVEQR